MHTNENATYAALIIQYTRITADIQFWELFHKDLWIWIEPGIWSIAKSDSVPCL